VKRDAEGPTLKTLALLLAIVGTPVLAATATGSIIRSVWVEPECRERCAVIGQGLLVALAKSKGASGGCRCTDGSLIEWSGPSWATGAGILSFVVGFVLVLALIARGSHKKGIVNR
jgi:hypothetical protein